MPTFLSKKDHSKLTDEEVVKKILETGDNAYFKILYDRFAEKVFHKCVMLTNDVPASKDLTHDIMIKIFLNISKLKYLSTFSLWVHRITYNQCMDFLNLRKKFRTKEIEEKHYDTIGVDEIEQENLDLKEMRLTQLEDLFPKLKEEDRMVLLMRYKDKMSMRDIGKVLKIGDSALKMRLKRARSRLATLFTQNKQQ